MPLPSPSCMRTLSGVPEIKRLYAPKTALLMIGFQMEFFTGMLKTQAAEALVEKAVKLMDWADKKKIKTIHMQRTAKSPASPVFAPASQGFDLHEKLKPRKKHDLYPQYATSSFSGTIIHGNLQSLGIDTLILAGFTTSLPIVITAHDAWSLGYKSIVLSDLTASRDLLSWDKTKTLSSEEIQDVSLASIADNFADVLSSSNLMKLPFS